MKFIWKTYLFIFLGLMLSLAFIRNLFSWKYDFLPATFKLWHPLSITESTFLCNSWKKKKYFKTMKCIKEDKWSKGAALRKLYSPEILGNPPIKIVFTENACQIKYEKTLFTPILRQSWDKIALSLKMIDEVSMITVPLTQCFRRG